MCRKLLSLSTGSSDWRCTTMAGTESNPGAMSGVYLHPDSRRATGSRSCYSSAQSHQQLLICHWIHAGMIVFLLLLWAAIGHRITARLLLLQHQPLTRAVLNTTVDCGMVDSTAFQADCFVSLQVELCWGWYDSLCAWLGDGVRASSSN